jgi:tripartite-type tricarboxylate transporter receptor subunit TctC
MPWHKVQAARFLVAKVLGAIGLAAILLTAAADREAGSQNKIIKLVVPYTPGSGPDIVSRLMSEEIANEQGPTVVVENRPGGGTVLGTELVQHADPDGNTLLLVANSFVINPALKRGSYDVAKDFAPVCSLASTPMVLVVQGSSPYKTVADLIAAAREKPGELAFASGGPASSLHIAIEVLRRAANINITYVPFGGTAPAIATLLGGHVAAVWADYPTVVAQLQAGTLRGLVTTSHARVAALPDVPTFAETGLGNYEADIFYGITAPANTPPDTLAQLAKMFAAALQAPDMKGKLGQQGLFPVGICGAKFGVYMSKLADDYARIIREVGITTN